MAEGCSGNCSMQVAFGPGEICQLGMYASKPDARKEPQTRSPEQSTLQYCGLVSRLMKALPPQPRRTSPDSAESKLSRSLLLASPAKLGHQHK